MSTNLNYYDWLVQLIRLPYDEDLHSLLLRHLYETEFYAIIDKDENRREDGIDLRQRYEAQLNIPFSGPYISDDYPEYCTVLEMMIGLSIRMEDIMYDSYYGDRTSNWFWVMIQNLGLLDCVNDYYDEAEVDRILYIFLQRLYDESGHGGLFYTNDPYENFRDLEIWSQANRFLNEFES